VPGLELISSAPKGTLSGDRVMWNRVLPTGTGAVAPANLTVRYGTVTTHP
jgi:hypothetical protein